MLDTISMAEQLSGDYRTVFERADIYSTTVGGTEENKDERMMELYDLLMEAEHQNKPIEKLVGSDIELFCKNFFEEERTQNQFVEVVSVIYRIACVLLVYTIIDLLFAENQSDILPLVVGIIGGTIADAIARYWLKPIVFKNKKIKPIVYYFMIIAIFLGSVTGFLIVTYNYNIEINTWWLFVISGAYVAGYLLVRSIWRYKKYGSILKVNREERRIKKEFNRELNEKSLIKPSAEGMAIRFRRIRKRKQKIGKTEFTFQEFAQKIRREEAQIKTTNIIFAIIIAAIVLIPGTSMMLNETILEGLIFMGILGVIESFVCYSSVKSNKKLMKIQLQILEECEKRDIDIIEYVEEIKKNN